MKYKYLLLILSIVLCASCVSIEFQKINSVNACLPNAISFEDSYKVNEGMSKKHWSRLFSVEHMINFKREGHAYCIFDYNGTIWIYDSISGSRKTNISQEDKENPDVILDALFPLDREKGKFTWL